MKCFPPYFQSLALLLTAGLALGSCTQDPPGPTITDASQGASEVTNSTIKAFAAYTELQWSDEFVGNVLNPANWQAEVRPAWYNNELQATTSDRKNLAVTGGNLVITAVKENYTGPAPDLITRKYTSARINTKGLKDFNFGRVDVRAKLPKGNGLWPAIWMLGTNDSQVGWPACGELDMMELKGSNPTINYSTVHFGANADAHKQQGAVYPLPGSGSFADDYHIFTSIRGQNEMRWYVDGVSYFTLKSTDVSPYPFNNPFCLILNVAVGGTFDPRNPPDASTQFPQQMLVDYVRYYKYKE